MTSLDKIEQAAVSAATSGDILAVELTETLKLAVPIALTQLGQIAMMTTDLAFIGRLGDGAVAAAALAHTIFFVSFTVGMGLMSAVSPLAAQAYGARNPHRVRRSLRVGLWAAFLISLPVMALPFRGEQILLALGQSPAAARPAQQYLFGLVWGVAPALWFMAVRGFMGAVNRPQPALWITLAAIPANALLAYLLIYGEWGFPWLELFGAGLATSITNSLQQLALESKRPVIHEVLLVNDEKQAYARCIGANLNRGREAARAAASMIDIFMELDRSMPKPTPVRANNRNA